MSLPFWMLFGIWSWNVLKARVLARKPTRLGSYRVESGMNAPVGSGGVNRRFDELQLVITNIAVLENQLRAIGFISTEWSTECARIRIRKGNPLHQKCFQELFRRVEVEIREAEPG